MFLLMEIFSVIINDEQEKAQTALLFVP